MVKTAVNRTLGEGQQPHVLGDVLQQVSPSLQLVVSSHWTSLCVTGLGWSWCSGRYTCVSGMVSSCSMMSF